MIKLLVLGISGIACGSFLCAREVQNRQEAHAAAWQDLLQEERVNLAWRRVSRQQNSFVQMCLVEQGKEKGQ